MANIKYRQEMPRPGGYSEPMWQKVPRKNFSGYRWFAFGTAVMGGAIYFHLRNFAAENMGQVHAMDMIAALEPFLTAEKDRMILKQLVKNREEEAELMKDVPGWTVGTYYGKPVYRNPNKRWVIPSGIEFYAHRDLFGSNESIRKRIPIYDEAGNVEKWLRKPHRKHTVLMDESPEYGDSPVKDMVDIQVYPKAPY
ncbi:NADH dehydrogenase [ubiquinone] 1 alpha subcomplex subunit 13 [Lingula anatina]|uniref:NADH dehydrogenase [ubiquinone] 1 alpha subcomplex subunit 13 n=1 Tax=Lingula anatina TaxID=7574 RepID=A0A1S3H0W6_LINAN|nr:NADH dehydrogenase [ubiquinone] 1 alpha subcomplex subunit 13 [Lingula anatina]|eukprot:XP_013379785.1 NADH dehydrogenase [ubiquinone] 1 alpha subcomplex subunit 13 [Lingula anatina]